MVQESAANGIAGELVTEATTKWKWNDSERMTKQAFICQGML